MAGQKYRILYIQKTGGGGSTLSLFELVKGLNKDLFEPIVIFRQQHPYSERFKQIGIEIYILSNRNSKIDKTVNKRDIAKALNSYGRWFAILYREAKEFYLFFKNDFLDGLRLRSLIKKVNATIIHHNTSLPGNRATILAGRLLQVPQICHVRSFHELAFIDKILSRFISSFIYISKAVEFCYTSQKINKKKGQVVYNPVRSINGDIEKITSKIRTEFGISSNEKLIVNVARIERWKGQEYYIKAFSKVRKWFPLTKALIVGAPSSNYNSRNYYQEIKSLTKELNLTKHVIFTGEREDILQIMTASDVIVHSSSNPEPFGRVIVEGMLSKKPVIATAAGGVFEIITDDNLGLLVPMRDIDKMAEAIRLLFSNPELADKIGLDAFNNARFKFSIEKHVSLIQECYHKLIKTNNANSI